jgi:O-antigen/teichoic acid export membrane protein
MVLLAGIVGILFLTFLVVNPFLEWSRILNAPAGLSSQLALVATVVLACLSFQFVLKIVGTVMMAKQRSWVNDSMVAMANVASLGALILLTHLKPQGTLLSVALVYSIVPVVISIFIGLWFFLGEFSDLRPSFALVRLQYTKDLMGIGVQFFVIQIVGLVVYMSSSLLITQLSSPENVVKYNIAYRYLSPLNMAFTIVLTPLWSAYTDAYHRGDHAWIAKTLKRTGQMALLFGLGGIVMVLASGWVYRVWIGKGVEIPYLLTLALALFFALSNVVGVAVMFLNGIGKLRIQLWAGVLSALIHIPLSILLVRHIGFSGVAWSMVAVTMFSTALTYIQLHRILNGSAKGIWIQ